MIDSIFKRLSPHTVEALKQPVATEAPEINVEELTTALSSVKGELEVAHSSLQKIYEEANYVYVRLDHMEKSIATKTMPVDAKKSEDTSDDGSSGGVVVEKHLFIGEARTDDKLTKIQEAKTLTQDLLASIEGLSEKVKRTANPNNTPSARI
ncbi:MAG: hypothetical protein K0S08_857 [Gammaproteobacteria bacterium]|jgi:hypothetical protein|nr:hypothetical protein [Gammaproteobacteria bacterium]